MSGKISKFFTVILTAGILSITLINVSQVQAQFFDDTLEQDDLFSEDDKQFFEPQNDDLGVPPSDQDFTEGDKFVDDGSSPGRQGGITAKQRRFDLTLKDDRNDLPLNMAWGAGTGLLLGGWYALINEGDNRNTQQAIGLGIVLGLISGTLIGTRSIFSPAAKRPVSLSSRNIPAKSSFTPIVSLNKKHPSLGFQFKF